MNESFAKSFGQKLKSGGIKLVVATVVAILGINSFVITDSGEKMRVQNSMTGGFTWYDTEGVKLKIPFFSSVHRYNDINTIAITDDAELENTASAVRAPLSVTFADNYGGTLEASFRVKLPTSFDKMEELHQAVKGQKNLNGNTFQTFAKDMLNLTTDQFLAQDFMQGGKGAFKQRLFDQGQNGMLVTKREKVEVIDNVADQTLDGNARSQNETAKQYITKVVIQTDANNIPLRRQHSLTKYGIEVVQVDLGEFEPNEDLVDYVNTIKERERARAKVVADQALERDLAVTEQLKGDRERITAKNKRLMVKDAAVITEQQKVAVEKEKANLAVVQKTKELQIAKANEGIQEANAKAAKHEANAIKEKGFAEAAVKKANYQAIDKEVLQLEVQKVTMLANADAYKAQGIQMPLIVGGSGEGSNPLETMSSLKVLEQLGHPVK